MADKRTKECRSYNMSRVKNKDTGPEQLVRKFLFSEGFRYRKNDKRYPGKPDIVLPKYKTVVFVNGCFWHKHENCNRFSWPQDNADFWKKKIIKNVTRDKETYYALRSLGWNVIIIWQCELAKSKRQKRLELLCQQIKSAHTDVSYC